MHEWGAQQQGGLGDWKTYSQGVARKPQLKRLVSIRRTEITQLRTDGVASWARCNAIPIVAELNIEQTSSIVQQLESSDILGVPATRLSRATAACIAAGISIVRRHIDYDSTDRVCAKHQ
jgi:hypothetical protein